MTGPICGDEGGGTCGARYHACGAYETDLSPCVLSAGHDVEKQPHKDAQDRTWARSWHEAYGTPGKKCGSDQEASTVEHPEHYGGVDNPYEAIKVIEAWELGFALGNAVKYIARAGRKAAGTPTEDLEKALWYLQREIDNRKAEAE